MLVISECKDSRQKDHEFNASVVSKGSSDQVELHDMTLPISRINKTKGKPKQKAPLVSPSPPPSLRFHELLESLLMLGGSQVHL